MLQPEQIECDAELVGIRDVDGEISLGRLPADRHDRRTEATPAPVLVGGGIHEQPLQPRVEASGIAKAGQLSPAVDEGLLDGVLSEIRVAEDEASDSVEAIERVGHQEVERIAISVRRAFHEFCRSQRLDTPHLGTTCPSYRRTIGALGFKFRSRSGSLNPHLRRGRRVRVFDGTTVSRPLMEG